MEQQQIIRTLSYIIYGGQQNIERHLKLQEIVSLTPKLQRSPDYHSFELETRLSIDIQQTSTVLELLKNKIIQQDDLHLLYDILPEAVAPLETHLSSFLPFLKYLLSKNQSLNLAPKAKAQASTLFKSCSSFQQIGCLLMNELNTVSLTKTNHLKELSTELSFDRRTKSYVLNSKPHVLKFDSSFSSVASQAIVLAQFRRDDQPTICVPVLVQLRNEKLQPLPGVNIRYLGKSALESASFGVSFSNYVISEENIISTIHESKQENLATVNFAMKRDILNLQHSCKDLFKAFYLGYEYTSMRKQFKQGNEEVNIINYEAVHSRLTQALSFAVVYSVAVNKFSANYWALNDNLADRKLVTSVVFFKGFKGKLEEKILQLTQTVRECCGGFGMMRFSGFPSILERLILRIGDNLDYNKDITEIALTYLGKQTVSFLDEQHVLFDVDIEKYRVHYFNHAMDESALKTKIQNVGQINDKQAQDDLILLRASICQIISKKVQTEKEFLATERNVKVNRKHLYEFGSELVDMYCLMRFYEIHFFKIYRVASKVMSLIYCRFYLQILFENFSIFGEFNLGISRTSLFEHLLQKKETIEEQIKEQYPIYVSSLELSKCNYGILVGNSKNQEMFYKTLLDWSKNHNIRNEPETVKAIQQQIIPLLLNQKASL